MTYHSQVQDKKEKRNFNHMENNVYLGFHNVPTLTELAVLSLYSQAISHPYLWQVCGPGKQFTNVLDLRPLYARVKAHCQAIISNPYLLLSPDATSTTGALDGKVWEHPEAVYTVHAMMDTLPHLRGASVAFFMGALEV